MVGKILKIQLLIVKGKMYHNGKIYIQMSLTIANKTTTYCCFPKLSIKGTSELKEIKTEINVGCIISFLLHTYGQMKFDNFFIPLLFVILQKVLYCISCQKFSNATCLMLNVFVLICEQIVAYHNFAIFYPFLLYPNSIYIVFLFRAIEIHA